MKGVSRYNAEKGQRNNYIMNIMNLKLAQSTRTTQPRGNPDSTNNKLHQIIINTPSTLATQKKFHSCQMHRHNPVPNGLIEQSGHSLSKKSSYESSTRILTLKDIRSHIKCSQDSEIRQKSLKKSDSRGIFVSISRKNSISRQKLKQPVLKQQQCQMTHQQPKLTQRNKLNRYKDMARNTNVSRKINFG